MSQRGDIKGRAGEGDRLELLLFRLDGRQRFGINVLKVKEVIPCPRLTHLPDSHPSVCGVARLRGEPLSVMDLSQAIGRPGLRSRNKGEAAGSVIVTEFNRSMQGFLVAGVERIVGREWGEIQPPPQGAASASYMSGVTLVDGELVQVLDVERVLAEVAGTMPEVLAPDVTEEAAGVQGCQVLVVDDSAMARNQTARTLDGIGVGYTMARDGREALDRLRQVGSDGRRVSEEVAMIISDIEMPEMDGYTLTESIRHDPALSGLYILLHTSLNGTINTERAAKAGADAVLTKFIPDELARSVIQGIKSGIEHKAAV